MRRSGGGGGEGREGGRGGQGMDDRKRRLQRWQTSPAAAQLELKLQQITASCLLLTIKKMLLLSLWQFSSAQGSSSAQRPLQG